MWKSPFSPVFNIMTVCEEITVKFIRDEDGIKVM